MAWMPLRGKRPSRTLARTNPRARGLSKRSGWSRGAKLKTCGGISGPPIDRAARDGRTTRVVRPDQLGKAVRLGVGTAAVAVAGAWPPVAKDHAEE